jgi:hypothetical protein
MNSNDKYYEEWDKGTGRANIVLDELDKQVTRSSVLRHGNALVEDSNINNLDSFDLLGNIEDLPNEYGPVTKLESIDNILIALCEREAVSIYVRERALKDVAGSDTVAISDQFFNNARKMSGGYGCSHPDSVVNYGYYLYWYSWNKQSVIRYNTGNGIYPISESGMVSYFKDKANKRIGKIPTLGNPRNKLVQDPITGSAIEFQADVVLGGYNPKYDMYYIGFPKTYTGSTFSWVQAGDKETLGFSDDISQSETSQKWISFYDFYPDRYGYLNDKMLSFKDEKLWEHDVTDTRGNFHGNQYSSNIQVVASLEPSVRKVFNNLMIEGNDAWKVTSITTSEGQQTEMVKELFENINGEYSVDILMDTNTQGVANPLFEGNVINSNVINITLENDSTSEIKMFALNVFSQISERTDK